MVNRLMLQSFIKAFLLCILTLNPLWADDTEIFFNSASDTEIQPNLLFVLDGSGSMRWYDCADGTVNRNESCNDGTVNGTTTRLARMVDAMETVLENTDNVNVGLMRFSHSESGSRVTYPLRDINQLFCNDEPCGDDTIFPVTAEIGSFEDDAYEAANGEVIFNDPFVPVTTYDGTETAYLSALRFSEVNIPQGATVIDARIDFTSITDSDDPANVAFRVEDVTDSQKFEAGFNTIRQRDWTANSVAWTNVPAWENDTTNESPDLSTLLNRIVNKPDWCGGNAISLAINGEGTRLASAFERGAGDAPVLRVQYKLDSIPAGGGCLQRPENLTINNSAQDAEQFLGSNQTSLVSVVQNVKADDSSSGFSFENVDIPPGSEIQSATLTLTSRTNNQNDGPLTINISLENSGNPTAFSGTRNNLSGRPKTSVIPWNDSPTGGEQIAVAPDLSELVESIVGSGTWTSGNRINVFLEPGGGTGVRGYYSFNSPDSDGRRARLDIIYRTNITNASQLIQGPVTDVRTQIKEQLNQMVASGGTPSVGALLEAYRYYRGDPVDYGTLREADGAERFSRVSHPDSYTGGTVVRNSRCLDSALNSRDCANERIDGSPTYISPIQHECQSHHIVLVTDGEPDDDDRAVADAKTLTGGTCAAVTNEEGMCGAEVAQHIFTTDLDPATDLTDNITTHTIGFNFNTEWLESVADNGGGEYYTASSAIDLVTAVNQIVANVQEVDTTFVAPGATIDQFSRVSHREDVYLSLFSPSLNPRWNGNIKRFSLRGTPPRLFDVESKEAVDPVTGMFVENSRSFWSATADGNDITLGGGASLLDPSKRRLVSDLDPDQNILFSDSNRLSIENNALTAEQFGLENNDDRDNIIDWLHGYDVRDENRDGNTRDFRRYMGDPLHSRPAIVTYGGTEEAPDSLVFIGTNEGLLHAINTESGTEHYAFMPKELLQNAKVLFDNDPSNDRPYGIDGEISIVVKDQNNNGFIEEDDTALLYTGMRRGGRNYYGLDVSDKDEPKTLNTIRGGTGNFIELGQTWSQPVAAEIMVGSSRKSVLIFGGGYDSSQDDKATRLVDSIGRAIYIVDATTQELIWSGGHQDALPTTVFPNMDYSIPATVRVVTDGRDNLATQFYVGDMGGRVWRFDILNGETGAGLVDGGIIADLATDNEPSEARRFYHSTDLSTTRRNGIRYLNIAIGSGYQAHPLDTAIKDNFYVISYPFDYTGTGEYGIKEDEDDTFRPITEADLFDTTDNIIGEGDPEEIEEARAELAESQGWFINMEDSGEKILGASSTLNNVVRFIAYVPGISGDGCSPNIGSSFFYSLNLLDGTPFDDTIGDEENDNNDDNDDNGINQNTNDDEDSRLTKEDRKEQLRGGGLAPPVTTIFVKDGGPTAISGTEVLWEGDNDDSATRWYWAEYPE